MLRHLSRAKSVHRFANPPSDLTLSTTDRIIASALLLNNRFLFVARPSVLMTMLSIVASLGLPDLLNTGLHARMDGTLLPSLKSMSSPSAKAVTPTKVGTSLPTPEPDTTDRSVSHTAPTQTHTVDANTWRLVGRFRLVSSSMVSIFYSKEFWGYSTNARHE
jgi:hypothetical protein